MMGPGPDYSEKLLEALLDIPAFNDPVAGMANRTMLLRRLPKDPVATVTRYAAPLTDLDSIVMNADGWRQLLQSGEWALAIVTRNALPFARGTDAESVLTALLAELETGATPEPPAPIPEIVIGQDERLPVRFLEQGIEVSKSVAKILVTRVIHGVRQSGSGSLVSGTGWMIAPSLLITNHHVIEARDRRFEAAASDSDFQAQARITDVWFHFHDDGTGHWAYCDWELVHASRTLDYAVLHSTFSSTADKPLSEWGFLRIVAEQPRLAKGFRLNIIQHPQGGPKLIAIRSNFYIDSSSTAAEPARIRYLTDTEPGSSGSPVFDDNWKVLALHHAHVSVPRTQYRGEVITYNNQGIWLAAILRDLPAPIYGEIRTAQGWS
jgi:V8-like Glu-specific endopeptidase